MSNYPAGSMKGSGIDSGESVLNISTVCPKCDGDIELSDVTVAYDDWGTFDAVEIVCTNTVADESTEACGHTFRYTPEDPEPYVELEDEWSQ